MLEPETEREVTATVKSAGPPVAERIRDGVSYLADQVTERPARTLVFAAGAGYIVGGGLASALTARLIGTAIRVALRIVAVPLLAQVTSAWLEGLARAQGTEPAEESIDRTSH
jgi:hypothetical protein